MTRRLLTSLAGLSQVVITPGGTLFGPLKNGQCPVCLAQAPPVHPLTYETGEGPKQMLSHFLVDCQGKFRGGLCRTAFWMDVEKQ